MDIDKRKVSYAINFLTWYLSLNVFHTPARGEKISFHRRN